MSKLEDLYSHRHVEALELAERVRAMIEDFPAPEVATWADAGSLGHLVIRLRAMLGEDE